MQVLMAEFYKNLWEKRLPTLEALQQAQLTMIKSYRLREQGGPAGQVADRPGAVGKPEGNQLSPVYWADFVISGDWRKGCVLENLTNHSVASWSALRNEVLSPGIAFERAEEQEL